MILQSFDPRTLRVMKKLDPSIRRAALFEVEREWPEVAREFEATHMSPLYSLVTKERVSWAHAAGLEVVPWTVNKPEDWAKLADDGVDAIISDDPAAADRLVEGERNEIEPQTVESMCHTLDLAARGWPDSRSFNSLHVNRTYVAFIFCAGDELSPDDCDFVSFFGQREDVQRVSVDG